MKISKISREMSLISREMSLNGYTFTNVLSKVDIFQRFCLFCILKILNITVVLFNSKQGDKELFILL